MPYSGVIPIPPATSTVSGRPRPEREPVARRRHRQPRARLQPPHVGGPAPRLGQRLHRDPAHPVRAWADRGIGPHLRPPVDRQQHVDVAARRRWPEAGWRIDLEQPYVLRQVPRGAQRTRAPVDLLGHRPAIPAANAVTCGACSATIISPISRRAHSAPGVDVQVVERLPRLPGDGALLRLQHAEVLVVDAVAAVHTCARR